MSTTALATLHRSNYVEASYVVARYYHRSPWYFDEDKRRYKCLTCGDCLSVDESRNIEIARSNNATNARRKDKAGTAIVDASELFCDESCMALAKMIKEQGGVTSHEKDMLEPSEAES